MKKYAWPIYVLLSIISFSLFDSNELLCQNMAGWKVDNYAGINRTLFQPASGANSPLKWDLNLVETGMFFENNYSFLENTSTLSLLKNKNSILVRPVDEASSSENGESNSNSIWLDFFNNTDAKFAQASFSLMGPSFRIQLKPITIGLFFQARAEVNAKNVPGSLAYYPFEETPINDEINLSKFKGGAIAWGEIGVHLSKNLINDSNSNLSIGTNIKYLMPYEAYFIKNGSSTNLTKIQNDSLVFTNSAITLAAAGSAISSSQNNSANKKPIGYGIGLDLGVEYIKGETRNYQWKAGVSILDVGSIKANKNAQYHTYNTTIDGDIEIYTPNFADVENTDDFFQTLSSQILENPEASLEKEKFSMALPTAISVQFDYQLIPKFFVNIMAIQSVNLGKNSIGRSNSINVGARYESKWLGFAIPFVLHNNNDFRMGMAVRLGPLTLGSDNLFSVIKKQNNYTGSDVYLALKVIPLNRSKNSDKMKKSRYTECPKVHWY